MDYYSARPLSSQTTSKDWNTNIVTTTFSDVNPHQGVICLHCAYKNDKGKRVAGLGLLFGGGAACSISTLTGLVLANLAEDSGGDVGASLGLPMALMCVFFLLAIGGLVVLKGGNSLAPAALTPRSSYSRSSCKVIKGITAGPYGLSQPRTGAANETQLTEFFWE